MIAIGIGMTVVGWLLAKLLVETGLAYARGFLPSALDWLSSGLFFGGIGTLFGFVLYLLYKYLP